MPSNKEFNLPVTVLIGSENKNMRNITRGMRIDPGYKLKHGITLSISTILTLFSKIERHFLAKLPDSEEAIITDNTKIPIITIIIDLASTHSAILPCLATITPRINAGKYNSNRLSITP